MVVNKIDKDTKNNEILRTGRDLVKTDFMPNYPNATQWSTTHHVQVSTVNPNNDLDEDTGERPVSYQIMEKTHVFDANLQKKLLSEYKWNSKNKSQEYAKFLVDKKALITISFRQCDEATKTKIALRATYIASHHLFFIVHCINRHVSGISVVPEIII